MSPARGASRDRVARRVGAVDDVTGIMADEILATRPGRQRSAITPITTDAVNAARCDRLLETGWQRGQDPPVILRPPIPWDDLYASDRSGAFQLHAWAFLAPLLVTYGAEGGDHYLRYATAAAIDWTQRFPARETTSAFAWYDMAVGLRAYRLAYILDEAAKARIIDRTQATQLVGSLRLHLRVLADEHEYRGHSNHGIYQAAGQLAAALTVPELAESAAGAEQARQRLHTAVVGHFGDDGVHREHSPAYHWMVLQTLIRLRGAGLLAPEAADALVRAEDVMAWLVAPVGLVAQIGDSDRSKRSVQNDPHVGDPALRWAMTRGADGAPPRERIRVFAEGGYAVARDAWPAGDAAQHASYLVQTFGFHSRVHKHADDLSFVWYADGVDLLADSGKYGYQGSTPADSDERRAGFYYSDPNRMFVESTRAHNCLEIDGTSYRRPGSGFYGSALQDSFVDQESGILATACATRQFGSVRHTRLLIHRVGEWTLVIDHAAGAPDDVHDLAQHFVFGPELELIDPSGPVFELPSSRFLVVRHLDDATPDRPVRGQAEPQLRGFVARTVGVLTPTWTTAWRRSGVRQGRFVTLLTLADRPAIDAALRVNNTARRGRCAWTIDAIEHRLTWDRMDGPLQVDYTRRAVG
jgi:hypothetical protein